MRGAASPLALVLLTLGACSGPPASPGDRAIGGEPRPDGPAPRDMGLEQRDEARPDRPAPVEAGWPAGFLPAARNVPGGPLCNIPPDYVENGGDPVNPPCQVESDSFSTLTPAEIPSPLTLRVVTWNVEFGKQSAAVQQALLGNADLSTADVILLQEVPRHDGESVPPKINFARDLAQALKMSYLFAVQWDRRLKPDQGGEHGVAILSRYPLGNVTPIRHTPVWDWYPEKKDFGGRITLGVDLAAGSERVRVYSVHLENRDFTGSGRAKQGAEIRKDAAQPGRPLVQVLGGDLNTFLCNPVLATCNQPPAAEQVIEDLLADGWIDLLPGFNSWTELGAGLFPQRLDWIFGKQVTPKSHKVLQQVKPSDHVPLVAVF